MAARSHRRLFVGLFWSLLALSLGPLWGVAFFPTQDGPSHVYNAWLLLHLHDPALPAIGHYYLLNTAPSPNWIAHLLLAGLMLAVKPLAAEKILLSLYLVGLPLAARYAVRSVRPSAEPLCLLVFPLSYNFFVHMGFYNFIFCVPLFLVTVGYYWRHFRHGPVGIGRILGLAALGLVLYFSHLSGLVMALFVIGGDLLLNARALRLSQINPRRGPALGVIAAFVPSVILTALFLLRTPQADVNAAISGRMDMLERVLEYPFSLVSYAKTDRIYSTVFLLILLAAAGYVARRRIARRRGAWVLPVITAAAIGLSFVVPNNFSQGGFVFHRLVLFVFLLVILSLATVRWGKRSMLAVQLAAVAISLTGWGINLLHYRRINACLAELTALAPRLPENHTLLYTEANLNPQDSQRRSISWPVNPFLHAGCYLSLESRLVSLDNYEAIVGYFPVLFQPMIDPPNQRPLPVHNVDGQPPRITFPAGVSGRVDFMVFFTGGCPVDPTPRNLALQKQFAESFEQVGAAAPGAAAILYRAR